MGSRPIQVGDFALVDNQPYLIQEIAPEGIYISSKEEPARLILNGNQWQVDRYQEPHTVTFQKESIDLYSSLPPELILEIALSLTLEEIQNLCMTSNKFNHAICENEYFWRRKYLQDYREEPSFEVESWKDLYLGYNVYAFGWNDFGELGLGDRQDRIVPTLIPNIKAQQVAAEGRHSLILDFEGNVYAFGENYFGELGLGDRVDRFAPTLIPNIKAQQVVVGRKYSMILDFNGNVYAFGINNSGQLGLGDTFNRVVPTMIPNIKAQQIAAGGDHSFILNLEENGSDPSSGRVFAFGDNFYGELGLGDRLNRFVPTLIPNLRARQVTAGDYHSFILDPKGTVYAFGSNSDGELGLGDLLNRDVPILMPNIKAQQIAAGASHSLILDPEGNVYAFGDNDDGQLGLVDRQDRAKPSLVPNIKAHQVAAGQGSFIIDLEGNIYAFGSNGSGQLGLGSNGHIKVPTMIPNIKARQVAAGDMHSLILGRK
jgi:alpha-tubulin suppressor-like RCC1 family protein